MRGMKNILLAALLVSLSSPLALASVAKSSPMVTQVSRTRFEVSKRALERELRDPVAQLSTFVAAPSFGNGFFSGIRVSGFGKNCLLPRFGLLDGDVVEMVNGQPIQGPGDIMEVGQRLAKARAGTKVRVNISRGGEDVIHTYLVTE